MLVNQGHTVNVFGFFLATGHVGPVAPAQYPDARIGGMLVYPEAAFGVVEAMVLGDGNCGPKSMDGDRNSNSGSRGVLPSTIGSYSIGSISRCSTCRRLGIG